jgi:dihydrofolate reductase
MSKLILQMQMSLDGYVAAADPELDWQVWDWGDDWPWDAELKRDFNAVFSSIGCILLSRKMAEEGFVDHWKRAAKFYPRKRHFAFAQRVTDTKKVVFSKTLKDSRWENTVLAGGDLVRAVNVLKRQPGKDIIAFGGVDFATSLVKSRLVDEFHFFVNPTALGGGGTIFNDTHKVTRLKLIRSRPYRCGIVVNRYRPV